MTLTAQADAQTKLDKLLAGKVAGKPQSCLPHYRADDMVVIDDYTIAFREGSKRGLRSTSRKAAATYSAPALMRW